MSQWQYSAFVGSVNRGDIAAVSTWTRRQRAFPPDHLKTYGKWSLRRFAECYYPDSIAGAQRMKKHALICALSDRIAGPQTVLANKQNRSRVPTHVGSSSSSSSRSSSSSSSRSSSNGGSGSSCYSTSIIFITVCLLVGAAVLAFVRDARSQQWSTMNSADPCLRSSSSSSSSNSGDGGSSTASSGSSEGLYEALRVASRYPSSDAPKSVILFNATAGQVQQVARRAAQRRYATPQCVGQRLWMHGEQMSEGQLVATLQAQPTATIVFDWTTSSSSSSSSSSAADDDDGEGGSPSGLHLSMLKRLLDNRCALHGCTEDTARDAALIIVAVSMDRHQFTERRAGSDVLARSTHTHDAL